MVSNRDLIFRSFVYFYNNNTITLNGNTTFYGETYVTHSSEDNACTLTSNGKVTVAEGAEMELNPGTKWNIGGIIENNGTLIFEGSCTMNIVSSRLQGEYACTEGSNGYRQATVYTVLTGTGTITGIANCTWLVDSATASYADGKVTVNETPDYSVYYVKNGVVKYDTGAENLKTASTKFSLEGGSLELGKKLENSQGIVAKKADSSVKILSGTELKSNQVSVEGSGSVVLRGGGSYTMANGTNTLGTGVSVGEDWTGTVNTTGNTTALELDKLGVNGSKVELGSNSHTLAARDQSVAANLTSTGSISLVDNKLTLSGTNNKLGSLNVDSLEIAGGSTTITDGLTTGGDSSVATGATLTVGGNSTLGGKITNSGELSLSGNITILKDGFAVTTFDPHYQQGSSAESMTSGFISSSAGMTIQVVEGNSANATGAIWSVTDVNDGSYTFDEATGKLHVLEDKSLVETSFYINDEDTITYDQNAAMFKNINGKDATGLVLNGGNLVLSTDLLNDTMKITANKAGTVEISNGVTLNASQLNASQLVAGSDAVELTGKGTYILEDGITTLDANVKLGSDWSGTLQTTGNTSDMNLQELAQGSPSLDLGDADHTLLDQDQSVAANLNSGGSISLTGKKLTLSGTNNTLGSLNVGSLEIAGGSTEISNGLTTGGAITNNGELTLSGTSTLGGKITNSGSLNLSGNITILKDDFAVTTIDPHYQQGSSAERMNSGFMSSEGMEIQVVEGNSANATGANWSVTGGIYYTFDEATGKLHVVTDKSRVGTEFYINDGDIITYDQTDAMFTNIEGDQATGLVLNGGSLVLSTHLPNDTMEIVAKTADSSVTILSGTELKSNQVTVEGSGSVVLSGGGSYTMANDANTLGDGVRLGSGWSGTVKVSGEASALNISSLGASGSTIELGAGDYTLAADNHTVDATVEGADSVLKMNGGELALNATSTLKGVYGADAISAANATFSDGLTTDSISGTVSVTGGTVQETNAGSAISTSGTVALSNVTLGAVLNNSGTLSFAGNMTLDTSLLGASPEKENWYSNSNAAGEPGTTGGSGFRTIQDIYTVVTGTAADNTASWKVDNRVAEYADGKVLAFQEKDLTTYWVNTNSVISLDTADAAFTDDTATIALNGGTLLVDTALKDGVTISSTKDDATGGTVNMNGTVLSRSNLEAAEDRKITLTGSGAYLLEDNTDLGEGVELSDAWAGTVYTGELAAGMALDAAKLGTDSSTLHLGTRNSGGNDVVLMNLKAANVGNTVVPGALTLKGDMSTANNLEVQGMLTLGTTDCAATLTATGVLSTQGITLGNIGSSAYAAKLNDTALNLTVADRELLKLTGGSATVLTLGEAYNGETTLNGEQEVLGSNGKMIYSLAWQTPLSRAAAGSMLVLTANTNPTYVQDKVGETVSSYTHNGRDGLSILNDAYAAQNPQFTTPGSALAELIDAVDAGKMTDECLAAVAGASTAALGMALSGDVERQLSAIRNRSVAGNTANTITLASEKSGKQTGSRFFAWVNAEGNRAEQDADSSAAGYTLTSWGGTLGAGMQVNDKLTLGLALTAMYGDLQSNAPDSLKGDMDTTYVSAFARYNKGKWSHAFIGTVGTMAADYKRTVSHAAGSYNASGDTEGTAFGLMYEVSRSMQLSNRSTLSPVFNISYRHTEVDSYSESGADAALNVGKQSLDTVTAGAGARYAAVVGQRMLNRACGFEARALVKYDIGDRQSTTSTGFTGYATRAGIESAELGAFGVELGAGISVPVRTGSIFADAAVELRSDYTNFNATVGYRIQF
ncbi:MAG: autotransporter domain-containing protein [Akkermansia sp.]|nr:autotransporter domain-containing protein [Akkermansia sp.]